MKIVLICQDCGCKVTVQAPTCPKCGSTNLKIPEKPSILQYLKAL